MIRVGIVGGSGYTGGELLRLLLDHPEVEVTQATSESNIGKFAHQVHPHLRGRTQLRFISQSALEPCDVLFLALPHGEAQQQIERFAGAGRTYYRPERGFPSAGCCTLCDNLWTSNMLRRTG